MRQLFGVACTAPISPGKSGLKNSLWRAFCSNHAHRSNAMSNIVKTKFAGLLRGLLRRFEDGEETPEGPRPAGASTPSMSTTSPATPQPHQFPSPLLPSERSNPNELELPLHPILAALPMDLRAKVMQSPPPGTTLVMPVEKILSQLATGSVKISFGELRMAAPELFAHSGGENDSRPVTLPLHEILARLNPALLSRRSTQRQAEVGEEISGPFDGRGQGLKISTESLKAPAAPIPFVHRGIAPAAANGTNGTNHSSNGVAKPVEPSAPAFNKAPLIPIDHPIFAPLAALSEEWPEALQKEIVNQNLTNAQVALPPNLVEPALKRGRVIFAWRYIRSWINPPPPQQLSIHDGIELELPLKVLAPLFFSHGKNGAARKKVSISDEIPNLFFGFPQPNAEVPVPVAPAPAPRVAPTAPVKPTPAPKPLPAQRPLPRPADAIPAKLTDTNFYIWGENGEVPRVDSTDYKHSTAPATDFTHRYATPQEVVARAMALPGVNGVIIALPDGLKVASQIPQDLNGDTLAAFLPQIYDRVSQSTKELRMGALNNLRFTVGNVPWKIFRVNAVYFAVFGHPGKPLPTAELAVLAAELDRKKQ